MPISVRHHGDVRILDLEGDFTLGRPLVQPLDLKGEHAQDLAGHIGALLDAGHNSIILNLARLRFIDSSGLGELIACRKRTLAKGGDIKLLNPGGQVHQVLVLTLLADVFDVYDDETNAVAAFAK